jgi:uncharacterized protein (TIGR02594 family)
MRRIETSLYEVIERFKGIKEVNGQVDNPQIMAMLKLDQSWPEHDEVPWCSALINYGANLLNLPRSKDLRARSWLKIGKSIHTYEAEIGSDIIIIKRGEEPQPGPDVIDAPGHVGCFAGFLGDQVLILGGNQANTVGISKYPAKDILDIRRLY